MLGPPIFLLNVNDFSEKLEGAVEIFQFDDDTSMICKFDSNESVPLIIEILDETKIPDRGLIEDKTGIIP